MTRSPTVREFMARAWDDSPSLQRIPKEVTPMPQRRSGSVAAPSRHKRRFKPRELMLGDGDRVVLEATGLIVRIAQDGTTKQAWAPDDPEWPSHAIRFGLQPSVATPNPHGRTVRQERPSRQ